MERQSESIFERAQQAILERTLKEPPLSPSQLTEELKTVGIDADNTRMAMRYLIDHQKLSIDKNRHLRLLPVQKTLFGED